MRPIVLSIAGSDSCAGAGVQADLKAIEANGAYATTAITAITAQNTRGVIRAEPLAPDLVRDQIDAVFADIEVAAVKSGMLAEARVVLEVAAAMRRHEAAVFVCDPVMISKTGFPLLDPSAVDALRDTLLPLATLITPNVHEAESLSGARIGSVEDAEQAGRAIASRSGCAVLITGGHLDSRPATDVLVTPTETAVFPGQPVDSPHTHGTGCTYASAIAARLARGFGLKDAIRLAKAFVTEAIRHGLPLGRGVGPTDPFHAWQPATARGEHP